MSCSALTNLQSWPCIFDGLKYVQFGGVPLIATSKRFQRYPHDAVIVMTLDLDTASERLMLSPGKASCMEWMTAFL
jgi:hypothetical protein